ncbi:MAG: AAA family ATPase, partial [Myxococcales bacterium]|nr:AAA family ATPase [Myxococcales bacterium]
SHAYGTPAYMAPEQCIDSRPGEAADWYSVGVMLYEALTGTVPFNGLEESIENVLYLKVTRDPPAPRALDPSLPADLDDLCVGLLQRDPRDRISELEVVRRLGVAVGHEHKRSDAPDARVPLFVGRKSELASLHEAYERSCAGEPTILLVSGESGVGKSELVRRFVPAVAGATVLVGRCYERESVPYKAWDGVVDHLSDVITDLGNEAAAALVPEHADLLLNAFPVLRRVEALVRAPVGEHQNLHPHERRARVFAALRNLLTRVVTRSPLVIVIDDLQWADQDSMDLLAAVTQPPHAPAMLLLATVRDNAEPEVASRVRARLDKLHNAKTLRLEPLPRADAERLARLLAGESPDLDAAAVAVEAGGHPMFIEELVRHIGKEAKLPNRIRLDQALTERIAQLSPSARRVVEVLAVAGRPVARDLGARALAMDVAEFVAHVEMLQAANIIRTDGTRRTDKVEPYHDRVRQAVLGHLGSAAKRNCHERLAVAFETSGGADPEALSIHWHGAGDDLKAARFATAAAKQAFDALAFDRAARLYKQAIELGPNDRDIVQIWGLLAESLVNSVPSCSSRRSRSGASTGYCRVTIPPTNGAWICRGRRWSACSTSTSSSASCITRAICGWRAGRRIRSRWRAECRWRRSI